MESFLSDLKDYWIFYLIGFPPLIIGLRYLIKNISLSIKYIHLNKNSKETLTFSEKYYKISFYLYLFSLLFMFFGAPLFLLVMILEMIFLSKIAKNKKVATKSWMYILLSFTPILLLIFAFAGAENGNVIISIIAFILGINLILINKSKIMLLEYIISQKKLPQTPELNIQ